MPVFLTHTKPLILEKSEVGFYNHYHYDVEIKYVVDGNFRVVEEGVAYDLKKGDIWIGFPFIEHSFESDGENDVVLAIFSPDDTPQLAKTFCTTRPVCPVINVSALAPGFGGELVRMAKERGIPRLHAEIYSFNAQSQRMFESAGFRRVKEERYELELRNPAQAT